MTALKSRTSRSKNTSRIFRQQRSFILRQAIQKLKSMRFKVVQQIAKIKYNEGFPIRDLERQARLKNYLLRHPDLKKYDKNDIEQSLQKLFDLAVQQQTAYFSSRQGRFHEGSTICEEPNLTVRRRKLSNITRKLLVAKLELGFLEQRSEGSRSKTASPRL